MKKKAIMINLDGDIREYMDKNYINKSKAINDALREKFKIIQSD